MNEFSNILHTSMSVEGAIAHAKDLKGAISVDGRRLYDVKEIKEILRYHLEKGRLVLPMCDCEGFDFQKGCPGHKVADAEAHESIMPIARSICRKEQKATCERWCGISTDCEPYQAARKIYEERKKTSYKKSSEK